ncbi:MAG: hypothetical protein JO077_18205 [Verrucomicrobia bacterium]|nr:hypothetical protein [Verrucomicrobiota bacterium]
MTIRSPIVIYNLGYRIWLLATGALIGPTRQRTEFRVTDEGFETVLVCTAHLLADR